MSSTFQIVHYLVPLIFVVLKRHYCAALIYQEFHFHENGTKGNVFYHANQPIDDLLQGFPYHQQFHGIIVEPSSLIDLVNIMKHDFATSIGNDTQLIISFNLVFKNVPKHLLDYVIQRTVESKEIQSRQSESVSPGMPKWFQSIMTHGHKESELIYNDIIWTVKALEDLHKKIGPRLRISAFKDLDKETEGKLSVLPDADNTILKEIKGNEEDQDWEYDYDDGDIGIDHENDEDQDQNANGFIESTENPKAPVILNGVNAVLNQLGIMPEEVKQIPPLVEEIVPQVVGLMDSFMKELDDSNEVEMDSSLSSYEDESVEEEISITTTTTSPTPTTTTIASVIGHLDRIDWQRLGIDQNVGEIGVALVKTVLQNSPPTPGNTQGSEQETNVQTSPTEGNNPKISIGDIFSSLGDMLKSRGKRETTGGPINPDGLSAAASDPFRNIIQQFVDNIAMQCESATSEEGKALDMEAAFLKNLTIKINQVQIMEADIVRSGGLFYHYEDYSKHLDRIYRKMVQVLKKNNVHLNDTILLLNLDGMLLKEALFDDLSVAGYSSLIGKFSYKWGHERSRQIAFKTEEKICNLTYVEIPIQWFGDLILPESKMRTLDILRTGFNDILVSTKIGRGSGPGSDLVKEFEQDLQKLMNVLNNYNTNGIAAASFPLSISILVQATQLIQNVGKVTSQTAIDLINVVANVASNYKGYIAALILDIPFPRICSCWKYSASYTRALKNANVQFKALNCPGSLQKSMKKARVSSNVARLASKNAFNFGTLTWFGSGKCPGESKQSEIFQNDTGTNSTSLGFHYARIHSSWFGTGVVDQKKFKMVEILRKEFNGFLIQISDADEMKNVLEFFKNYMNRNGNVIPDIPLHIFVDGSYSSELADSIAGHAREYPGYIRTVIFNSSICTEDMEQFSLGVKALKRSNITVGLKDCIGDKQNFRYRSCVDVGVILVDAGAPDPKNPKEFVLFLNRLRQRLQRQYPRRQRILVEGQWVESTWDCHTFKKYWETMKNWASIHGYELVNAVNDVGVGPSGGWMKDFPDHIEILDDTETSFLSNFQDTCIIIDEKRRPKPLEFNKTLVGVTVDLTKANFRTLSSAHTVGWLNVAHGKFNRIEIILEKGDHQYPVDTLFETLKILKGRTQADVFHDYKYYVNGGSLGENSSLTTLNSLKNDDAVAGIHFEVDSKVLNRTSPIPPSQLRGDLKFSVGIVLKYSGETKLADKMSELISHCNYAILDVDLFQLFLKFPTENETISPKDLLEGSQVLNTKTVFDNLRALRYHIKWVGGSNVTVMARIKWPTLRSPTRKAMENTLRIWNYVHEFSTTFNFPFFIYEAFDGEASTETSYGWWKTSGLPSSRNDSLPGVSEKLIDYIHSLTSDSEEPETRPENLSDYYIPGALIIGALITTFTIALFFRWKTTQSFEKPVAPATAPWTA